MIIIDPVSLGDTSCTRASVATYFDRNGTLQTAAANTLRVTYDPLDLANAPYALVENTSTNAIRNNTMAGAVQGTPGTLPTNLAVTLAPGLTRTISAAGTEDGIDYIDLRVFGTPTSAGLVSVIFEAAGAIAVSAGQVWVLSAYVRLVAGTLANVAPKLALDVLDFGGAIIIGGAEASLSPMDGALRTQRWTVTTASLSSSASASIRPTLYTAVASGVVVDFTLRIGLPQVELDRVSTPIKTSGIVSTRNADNIGSSAGMVYSNVPITEQDFKVDVSYAKDAIVHDPATHLTYKSVIDANKGNSLTDPQKWTKGDVTNRWKMVDQYNNTQTINAEEILMVVSPQQIAQGFYIGNTDANEIRASVVDLYEGVVYREVQNLTVSSSEASFFNWFFKRIHRKTYAVSVLLPVYANALIAISIRKPGGVPKCGMCAIGPVVDIGLAEWGISTEIKDYSTTTFQFDGTSDTQVRGYSRRMSLDVEIDNDQKDVVEETLAGYRQKPVAWIGTVLWGSACLFGRYSSFKNVLSNLKKSKMSLQIEGTVQ